MYDILHLYEFNKRLWCLCIGYVLAKAEKHNHIVQVQPKLEPPTHKFPCSDKHGLTQPSSCILQRSAEVTARPVARPLREDASHTHVSAIRAKLFIILQS